MISMLCARASAHGAGAWKDPNHYVDDSSVSGLRLISEGPPHHLKIVGTDNGKDWWALSGSCANGADGSMYHRRDPNPSLSSLER